MIARIVALAMGVILLIPSSDTLADTGDREVTIVLRRSNARIQQLMSQDVKIGSAEEEDVKARIASEVRGILNLEELGRRALRDHIDSLSKAREEEFLNLLSVLVEQNYIKALRARLTYEVRFLSEIGDHTRKVATEVHTTRRGRPYVIQIDYLFRKENKHWRAYDVVTDGVSLIRNYRAQFNRIIAKEGIDGLLGRMKRRHERSQ